MAEIVVAGRNEYLANDHPVPGQWHSLPACGTVNREAERLSLTRMKTVWRVFAYLKRYPLLGIATLGCAIVGTLMVIVFPGSDQVDHR